jgi:hypothetical protein
MIRSTAPSDAAVAEKALVDRKSLIGFRAACEQMWGATGLAAIRDALMTMTRVRKVSVAHGVRESSLWVTLRWDQRGCLGGRRRGPRMGPRRYP